ncbi:hypothetical protein ABVT39_027913 [Epinephelus coioides]
MSQWKTTRVVKKKTFPDFVEAPGPSQQPQRVNVTTSTTTGPKDAPGKRALPQPRQEYPYSEDLFDEPPETSADLSKFWQPSSNSSLTQISSDDRRQNTPVLTGGAKICVRTPQAVHRGQTTPVVPGKANTRARTPQVISLKGEHSKRLRAFNLEHPLAILHKLILQEVSGPKLRGLKIKSMSHLGGKDLKTCTRRILDRVFSNAVQRQYNLMGGGRQGKRALKKTAFFSVVLEAVRVAFPQATEEQVSAAVGDHLKQAPARCGGGGYRRPRPTR